MKFIPNEEHNSELLLTKEDLMTPNLSIEEVLSARPWVILTKEAHQAYVDAAVVIYTDGSKSFKMKNAFGHAKRLTENNMTQTQVDALFQITLALHENEWFGKRRKPRNRTEVQRWVTHQLAQVGIYTTPCGSSWGILSTQTEYEKYFGLNK